jgi:hypothetical protein
MAHVLSRAAFPGSVHMAVIVARLAVMIPQDPDESPESLRRRAQELRECARRARMIAETLGPFLDQAVTTATTKDVWQGWYARETTQRLKDRKRELNGMANQLVSDAAAWVREAEGLERQAEKAQKAAK